MSNIAKFFVMALAWLVFFLVTFLGCIRPKCCPSGSEGETGVILAPDPEPAPTPTGYALASRVGAPAILTGSTFPALRDRLLAEYNGDDHTGDVLEVKGYYYEDEPIPEGYENMGFARAAAIIDEVAAMGIPRERMAPLAEKITEVEPFADGLFFPAGQFDWEALAEADLDPTEDRVREDIDDRIIVEFPFNERTASLSDETENYLKTLAERIQETQEQVTIVGHTDNVDTDAFNLRLGQQRADFIRDRLVNYGAPGALISTSSEGESNPIRPNDTPQGRARNRRTVITLQKTDPT